MKSATIVVGAALLLAPIPAHATPAEDAYLAARDRDIAELAKLDAAKDTKAQDAQADKAMKDLDQKMRAIIGPVAIAGFPATGKLNLDALSSGDEGFGMLDGMTYGESESAKNLVVTTAGLLDKWLVGHRHWWSDTTMPTDPSGAIATEAFYTQAVSTDAAVVHYGAIPVVAPPGAKFAHATLSARTQDGSPNAPEEMFVTLEHNGRVFIVNEKLATPMSPIAACDAVTTDYAKKAEAADKSYVSGGLKDAKLTDQADKLRNEGDAAFRACYGTKVKDTPAFKAATDQAAAIIAAVGAK